MRNCTETYIEDDIKELERLRGLLKADPENQTLFYEYQNALCMGITGKVF